MNFWATRLSEQTPTAPVKASPAPVQVQGAWFSNPLLNGQQTVPQQVVEVPPGEEVATVTTKKILASRNAGTCPSCGGEYYGRAGSANTYARCYECGYNSRFEQAMQGAGSTSSAEGPATAAKQVASGGGSINNFHPDKGTF